MKDLQLRLLPAFFVAALTVLAFLPIIHNDFVLWDDFNVIQENPNIRGLGWNNLHWMFTTFYKSLYRPLAWMTFAADYLAWGLNPAAYHATSLALHAVNAALVYLIALRLYRIARPAPMDGKETRAALAAGFAALFFALHPFAVEPVAWASAVSDPLAALFTFLALLCYLRSASDAERSAWMVAAWSFYGLSLLSKASGVAFPIVLLALDVYPLKRLGGARTWFGSETARVWLEKIPFFALSAAGAVLAVLAKGDAALYSWSWTNLVQPLFGIGFYLTKTILPIGLSPIYPQEIPSDLWQWRFAPLPVLAAGATAAAIALRRRFPAALTAWVCYAALLLPSSGIVRYGPQLVADRYAYVPTAALGALLGATFVYFLDRRPRVIMLGCSTAILLALAILTYRQTLVWRDSETLFRHAVAVAPDSALAHQSLGAALANERKFDEAIEQYRRALVIVDAPAAHHGLGVIFSQQGKIQEAIAEYVRALRRDAAYQAAREELALLLIQQGRTAEAEAEYRVALRIDPTFVNAHNNLAFLLAGRGRFDEAITEYREAAKLDDTSAFIHANLGDALLESGRPNQAVAEFRRALQLDPNLPEARSGLERALSGSRSR